MAKLLAVAVGTMALFASPASAAIDFSLSFAPVDYTAVPNGTVEFQMILANTGTTTLTDYQGAIANGAIGVGQFRFTTSAGSLGDRLSGLNLAAGDSLTFTVGQYTLFGGTPGTTVQPLTLVGIRFGDAAGDDVARNATNLPSITIAAVPEPASWAMMITGFGLVGSGMRRARATGRIRMQQRA